jgi:hypothetical protein
MNIQLKLWILLDLVFLVVFNSIFFIIEGTNQPAGVWVAYVFIHISYIMLLVTSFMIRPSNRAALFGMTLYTISATYFLVTLVCGLVFIFRYPKAFELSLISQIIISGLYTGILLSNLLANERTADALVVHERELQFVKTSSAQLSSILNQVQDKELQHKVERAYDLAHGSQIKSAEQVRGTEAALLMQIQQLADATSVRDEREMNLLVDQIISGIEKRNRDLKFL